MLTCTVLGNSFHSVDIHNLFGGYLSDVTVRWDVVKCTCVLSGNMSLSAWKGAMGRHQED